MVIVGLGFWGSHEANSLYKNHIGTCTQVNEKTVELSGKIDVYMNDCAATMLTQNVTDIIVDSPGGDVVHGRKIGYKIGERDQRYTSIITVGRRAETTLFLQLQN